MGNKRVTSINNEELLDVDEDSLQPPAPSYDGQSQLSNYHSSKNPTKNDWVTNQYDYSKMSSINTEHMM